MRYYFLFILFLSAHFHAHSMNAFLPVGKNNHQKSVENNSLGVLAVVMGTGLFFIDQKMPGATIAACGACCLASNYYHYKKVLNATANTKVITQPA